MALAVGNVVDDMASSTPISYTITAGAILVVVIGMAWEGDNDIGPLTYNASGLTEAVAGGNDDPNDWGRVEVWYHLTPASGANDLAITSGDNTVAPLVICEVTGADTSGLGTGTGQDEGDSNALDVDITPEEATSLLIAGFCFGDGGETLSATGGSTLHGQRGTYAKVGLASKAASSTASHNIALASTDIDGWAAIAMEIKVAGGAATVVKDLIGGGVIPFAR